MAVSGMRKENKSRGGMRKRVKAKTDADVTKKKRSRRERGIEMSKNKTPKVTPPFDESLAEFDTPGIFASVPDKVIEEFPNGHAVYGINGTVETYIETISEKADLDPVRYPDYDEVKFIPVGCLDESKRMNLSRLE